MWNPAFWYVRIHPTQHTTYKCSWHEQTAPAPGEAHVSLYKPDIQLHCNVRITLSVKVGQFIIYYCCNVCRSLSCLTMSEKGEKGYTSSSHGLYSTGTLLIYYSIFFSWITDILEMAASWTFLQSCLLECTSLHSFICPALFPHSLSLDSFSPVSPSLKAKYSSLHRVVSSPPGHPGSARFVDLILVWCCLSS